MQYSIILFAPEASEVDISPELMATTEAAFDAYAKDLDASGVLVSADILQPTELTTTVTVRGGELTVQDGPFVETKEKLNGTFVIEVETLDDAIAIAAQCPGAQYGTIEVRPSAIVFRDGSWMQPA
jgi:hypothetical protein